VSPWADTEKSFSIIGMFNHRHDGDGSLRTDRGSGGCSGDHGGTLGTAYGTI
jgi:hypothetical protein